MIRVTGGKYKGRTLKVQNSKDLRPTTSFFREWLFNVLNNMVDLSTCKVLDLFSGSGIVGIEFLSRGAEQVTFVEKERFLGKEIESSLSKIGESKYNLIFFDVLSALKKKAINLNQYNIIFLDPPYSGTIGKETIEMILSDSSIIDDDAIIIYESHKKEDFVFSGFEVVKEKRSGTTKISILMKVS